MFLGPTGAGRWPMKLGTLRNERAPRGVAIPRPGGQGKRKRPRRSVGEPLRPATTRKPVGGARARGAGGAGSMGEVHPKANGEERRRVLAAILCEARRARVEPPPARSGLQDLAAAAQEIEEEIVRVATLERRRRMMAQADEALHRLAAGRYGLCADCGNPISPARLRAVPFATRCCGCQERFERRAGRGGALLSAG